MNLNPGKSLNKNVFPSVTFLKITVTHLGKTLLEEASSALSDIMELQNKETEITEALNNPNLTDEEKMDFAHQLGEVHHMLEGLDSYSALNLKLKKF